MKQKITIFLIVISLSIGLYSCNPIVVVVDSSQLLDILNLMEYEYYPLPEGSLSITTDILVSGTVTISSEELEVPEKCSNSEVCRFLVGFDDKYGAEGISLTPSTSEDYPPGSLTLTNVMLRFRTLVINLGGPPPDDYNKIPVIQLLPPSYQGCEDTQTRCDKDQVCYDDYLSYCLHCLALSQEECVCRDEKGIYPDGTSCRVITGDDTLYHGECQNGECIRGDY